MTSITGSSFSTRRKQTKQAIPRVMRGIAYFIYKETNRIWKNKAFVKT